MPGDALIITVSFSSVFPKILVSLVLHNFMIDLFSRGYFRYS